MREDGFDFGAKNQYVIGLCIKKGPDTQPVTSQEERLRGDVPDSDGKLSVEIRQAIGAKVFVQV